MIFTDVWQARHAERMTRAVDFREVLREVCNRAGVEIDSRIEEIIESLHVERLAAKAKPLIAVESDVIGALAQLRAAGIKLGLVSNCSVEEVASWDSSPLAPLFDAVTFSYRVGLAKPSREIYLRSCQDLGAMPERTAFVGDGGSDELNGATAAGLTAYCARWFLDRWPAERRDRSAAGQREFPMIMSPAGVITEISGGR